MNCGTKSKKDIIADIDCNSWLGSYSNSLIELFIHLGSMNSLGEKFTLFNAHEYHKATKTTNLFLEQKVLDDVDVL